VIRARSGRWFVRRILDVFSSSPVERLKRGIRALEDEVPRLNEVLALLKAEVTLAEREVARRRAQEEELEAKARGAAAEGRADLAECYAEVLADVRGWSARDQAELERARAAFVEAQGAKRAFMEAKEARIRAAQEGLRAQRRAAWSREAAEVLAGVAERLEAGRVEDEGLVAGLLAEAAEGEAALREAALRLAAAVRVRDSGA
jgi:phage shock protein A